MPQGNSQKGIGYNYICGQELVYKYYGATT